MMKSKTQFEISLNFVNDFISKAIPERAKMFMNQKTIRR